jgi:hypothetical protein
MLETMWCTKTTRALSFWRRTVMHQVEDALHTSTFDTSSSLTTSRLVKCVLNTAQLTR